MLKQSFICCYVICMTIPLKEPIFSLKVYLEFRNITHNTIYGITSKGLG